MGKGKKITYVRRKREEGEKINGITQTEEREKGEEETFSRTHSKRSKLKNRPRMVSLLWKTAFDDSLYSKEFEISTFWKVLSLQ